MNTKNTTLGIFIATTLVLAVIAFKNPSVISVPTELKIDASTLGSQRPAIVNVPAPIVNVAAPNVNVNVPKQTPTLGALTGPEISSNYITVGGVRHEYYSFPMIQATTTPCTFATPTSTSTLLFTVARVSSSTPSATTWTLAKSTVPNATTTRLTGDFSLSANIQGTMVLASSTVILGVDPNGVIAPNTFVSWGAKGLDGSAVNSVGGICKAEFLVL